ncbi:MAG: hypothetical protein NTV06_06040, partial [candidate division Zixibacteria bacterium]|nr:hypothetical protein [candidate division Zixibacteria bacterium]
KKVKNIFDLIDSLKSDGSDFGKLVLRHSFPGIISDPISNIRAMAPENIEKIAAAMMHVVKK